MKAIKWLLLFPALLGSCIPMRTLASPTSTIAPTLIPLPFPLSKGTMWVYQFETYEPSETPSQIVKAIYQLTETVIETKNISSYFVAHLKNDYQLVNADAGWRGFWVSSQPKEIWLVVDNQQVFESHQPIDAIVDLDKLVLEYQFPLMTNKNWCQTSNCEQTGVGWRGVESQSSYKMSSETFDDCYDVLDHYNGGGLFHTFCNGVGVVSMKFDHLGTPYGFQQTLISYFTGVP